MPQVGTLLSTTRSGRTFFAVQDSQETVTTQLDSAGAVAAAYVYDAYGNLSAASSQLPGGAYGFAGLQSDTASGLLFARARYYDPTIGRFLSEDPLWAINRYVYARNDPADLNDPSGAGITDDAITRAKRRALVTQITLNAAKGTPIPLGLRVPLNVEITITLVRVANAVGQVSDKYSGRFGSNGWP